jgi:ATP:corrinoid adenosyltransferase
MAQHVSISDVKATRTETQVAKAILKHLREHDVLLTGVRFHDHEYGDVEIDALILFPDVGIGVIEVKGGHISFADNTFWQQTPGGVKEIDPAGQTLRGWYSLRRFIERQSSWSRGKLRGDWFMAFPDTEIASGVDMGPQGRRETIFAKNEDEDIAGRIFDILNRPQGMPLPGEGWVDQVVELIQGANNARSTIEQRVAQRLQHTDQLTTNQSKILDLLRNTAKIEIVGGAGTGKTWLAMEQARRWSQDGLRVAFLTYTRGLNEMVTKAMATAPTKQQPAFIGTFHYLGYFWGVKPTEEEQSDQDYWNSIAPQLFEQKANALPEAEKFDAIVVDEAQDFAQSWWPAVIACVKDVSTARIAIFRDDAQDVFEGRHARPDITVATFPLDDNLRNARQVVSTFAPLTDYSMKALGGEGFPTRIIFADPEHVIDSADEAISQLVDHDGWLPEHVALLTTKTRHPVHTEALAHGKDTYWQDMWETDDVFYSTVSGFKGLERPAIVIAMNGFHDHVNPKHLIYTAITRASDFVTIVGTKQELLELFGDKHLKRLLKNHPFAS